MSASMSRQDHYQRAQEVLGEALEEAEGPLSPEDRKDLLAAAQVHATLAAAPAEVAGDYPERRVLSAEEDRHHQATREAPESVADEADGLKARVEAALEELERRGRKPTTSTETAAFIRRLVFGDQS